MADAHFASKNTLLKRNTLHCYILLKRTVCFKLACYSLLFNTLYPSTHFASWNVFLLGTLCSPTPFASKNPFLLNTVCFSTPFAPQNTLLLNTLCSSAHCAPQNTLLLSTLCFKEHFTPWNTLLLNTLCFKEHFTPRNTLLLRTFYSLAHFAPWNTLILKIFAMPWFTNIPNTIFFEICYSIVQVWVLFHTPISHHGQMNSKEQNVSRSKVFHGGKCVE